MLDSFTKKRIEKILSIYIEAKVPKQVRNQIRLSYKFRGNSVTLNEEQPAYIGDGWTEMPVAQFRYEESKWKIYWQDSKRKWHFVDDFAPQDDFEKQLEIVDNDSRGMFWG
ncbi:DUF3024 domain-containing protein [Paenibacillus sp. FSL R10-2734]|uniref:DUF3024 domain-containing protein n=1 Tax=Paenibacillus sp. FSL R10-2734 TaxID=2954691 RepID=UPI0030D74FE8